MKKKLAALLIGAGVAITSLAGAQPAAADGVGHSLNIYNVKASAAAKDPVLIVGRNWPECAVEQGTLRPGQSTKSKYGWKDADCVYVKSTQTLNIGGGSTNGWKKLRGPGTANILIKNR